MTAHKYTLFIYFKIFLRLYLRIEKRFVDNILFNNCLCTDINECLTGASNCSQVCINEDAAFSCNCFPGYLMNDDMISCTGNILIEFIFTCGMKFQISTCVYFSPAQYCMFH